MAAYIFMAAICCASWTSASGLWMPSHFADGMVLQTWNKYHMAAKLYGTGTPGEIVNATTDNGAPWMSSQAGPDGRWAVTYNLPPGSSWSASFTLTVRGNASATPLRFQDVKWGDLYVCIGDSAMLLPVAQSINGSAWLSSPPVQQVLSSGLLRLFAGAAAAASTPQPDFSSSGACTWAGYEGSLPCNTWLPATTQTAAAFSALCLQTVVSLMTAQGGNPGNVVAGVVQLAANSTPVDALLPASTNFSDCGSWNPPPAPAYPAGSLYNGMLSPIAAQTPRAILLTTTGTDLPAVQASFPGAYACRMSSLVSTLRDAGASGAVPLALPIASPALAGPAGTDAAWQAAVQLTTLLPQAGRPVDAVVAASAADTSSDSLLPPLPGAPPAPVDTLPVAARHALAIQAVAFWQWGLSAAGPVARTAAEMQGSKFTVQFSFAPNASVGLPFLGLHPSAACTAGGMACCTGLSSMVQLSAGDGTWYNTSISVDASNTSLIVTPGPGAPPSVPFSFIRYGAGPGTAPCFLVDTSSGFPALPFNLSVQPSLLSAQDTHSAPAPSATQHTRWSRPPPASEHVIRPDGSWDRSEYLQHGRARAQEAARRIALGQAVAPGVLQPTPPLGWNSWQAFRCNMGESLLLRVAAALVSTGLKGAGYNTVNMDDCEWRVPRLPNSSLAEDVARFPSGFFSLSASLSQLGLGFGVYTSQTSETCVGRPGAYGMEDVDTRRFCDWGASYVKVDYCGGTKYPSLNTSWLAIRKGLDAHCSKGGVVLSVETCGDPKPSGCGGWIRNSGAQLWRTTGDLQLYWSSVLDNLDGNEAMAPLAGPGAFNDPDMLIAGHPGLSADETRSHIGGWVISAAPLILSVDVSNPSVLTPSLLAMFTNPEVLAIDQDPAVVQGVRVGPVNATGTECWARPVTAAGGNATALFMLNRGDATADITCAWSEGQAVVRDVWARVDLGTFTGSFTARGVPSHGSMLLLVTPIGR